VVHLPETTKLLEKLMKGELRLEDILRHAPDPPRIAPILNRVIDEVMHPLAEKNKKLYYVDSALHIAVELGDALAQSLIKTIRYNIPKILEKRKEK